MKYKQIMEDKHQTEKKLECLAIDLLKTKNREHITRFLTHWKDKHGEYLYERLRHWLNEIKARHAGQKQRRERNAKDKTNVGKPRLARQALENS